MLGPFCMILTVFNVFGVSIVFYPFHFFVKKIKSVAKFNIFLKFIEILRNFTAVGKIFLKFALSNFKKLANGGNNWKILNFRFFC